MVSLFVVSLHMVGERDRQTDRQIKGPSTVTLTAHARKELTELVHHIPSANYAIGPTHLLYAIRDRASVNGVAMRGFSLLICYLF